MLLEMEMALEVRRQFKTLHNEANKTESSSQRLGGLWVRDEGVYPQRWDNLGHRYSAMDRSG